jgi:hypothetical protein
MNIKRIILSVGAAAVLLSLAGCTIEGDTNNYNYYYNQGGWQVIETVHITADAESVVFADIDTSWDILELHGYGTSTVNDIWLACRVNDVNDLSYRGGEYRDRFGLFKFNNAPSSLKLTFYPTHDGSGYVPISGNFVGGIGGGGDWGCQYTDPSHNPLTKIKIFVDYEADSTTIGNYIAPGSEFILLGYDVEDTL